MTQHLVIYGAYGYVGSLVARRAVEAGLRPILAGRDRSRLIRISRQLGLEITSSADVLEGSVA